MKKNLLSRAAIVGFILVAFMTTTASAFTAVMSGSWSDAATWGGVGPGTTVSNQDVNIPAGLTVTLDEQVSFSGLLNSFTVDGTLNASSNNSITMSSGSFAGSGTVNIDRLTFTSVLTTMSFSGTLTLQHFHNSGALLTLAAVTQVSDSLDLDAGSISIGSGGNLEMLSNSTIRVNDGSMSIGGGVFNSSNDYNVQYAGSSKTTGIELNTTTLQAMYLDLSDNTQSVTLGSNVVINGTVHMNTGMLDLGGKQLTLNGDLVASSSGSVFVGTATSTLTVNGNMPMTDGLAFSTGSTIGDMVINHSGSNVHLLTNLSVSGTLRLMSDTLVVESGQNLAMNAGSTIHIEGGALALNTATVSGTAYNVEYMGNMSANSGPEITTSGINNLTVDVASSSNTVKLNDDVTVGGQLALHNGKLDLNGHRVIANGTLDLSSDAMFKGSSSSDLELNLTATSNDTLYFSQSGSDNMLHDLVMNSGASSTLYLGTDMKIGNELNMMNGKLDINDHDLMMQSSASITGYDDTKYIVTSGSGKLQMNVNSGSTYVTFPVGAAAGYSPASIQQSGAGTSGNFMVSAMPGVYTNGTTGFNSASTGSMVNRTWNVSAAGGVVVNANLKFAWTSASEVNGFDRNVAYATRYNGSMWDMQSYSAATSGPSSTYEMERMANTSLGQFAVVDSAASVALGVADVQAQPVNILLYPNPATETIYIQVPKTDDVVMYELIDITGRTIYSAMNKNTISTFDVSNLNAGYYFIKATDMSNRLVTTKRFIKS